MLQSNAAIVDKAGRPTPFFIKQWNLVQGTAPTSLETRVTALEVDVAALQTTVSAQGASIAGLVADVSDLQSDVSDLTTRVDAVEIVAADAELRAVFGSTVWPGGVP